MWRWGLTFLVPICNHRWFHTLCHVIPALLPPEGECLFPALDYGCTGPCGQRDIDGSDEDKGLTWAWLACSFALWPWPLNSWSRSNLGLRTDTVEQTQPKAHSNKPSLVRPTGLSYPAKLTQLRLTQLRNSRNRPSLCEFWGGGYTEWLWQ